MQNPLNPNRPRLIRQASIAALAVLLLVFLSSAFIDGAAPVRAEISALQNPTEDYPVDGGDSGTEPPSGYPGITDVPGTGITPTFTMTVPGTPGTLEPTIQTTQLPTITSTITATLPVNIFATENAEIGAGNVTPPPSETPGPTITSYVSPTPTPDGTEATDTVSSAARKKNQSRVDWGLFWIGFSIPVLSACGLVLYLLDQRPDFFRLRKK